VIGYIHAHLNGSEGKCLIELLQQATLDLAETLNLDKLLMHDVAVCWRLGKHQLQFEATGASR